MPPFAPAETAQTEHSKQKMDARPTIRPRTIVAIIFNGSSPVLLQLQPADDIARIVKQGEEADPLNSSKAKKDARVGFDEVAEEAEGEVGDHEKFESIAGEEDSRKFLRSARQNSHFSQRTREMGHPISIGRMP
jgi:hypothetical protein